MESRSRVLFDILAVWHTLILSAADVGESVWIRPGLGVLWQRDVPDPGGCPIMRTFGAGTRARRKNP